MSNIVQVSYLQKKLLYDRSYIHHHIKYLGKTYKKTHDRAPSGIAIDLPSNFTKTGLHQGEGGDFF